MIQRVTLLGSSSGRNAGDAALIAGLMQAVDEECGRQLLYEIPTIRPSYIRDHYPNRTLPVSLMPWNFSVKMLGWPTWRSLRRSDLILIFDAILFDRSLFNPLFNFMSSLYLLLPAARRPGKWLGCYDVGLGPVNTAAGQRMLKALLETMDFITVRDHASLRLMQDLEVQNPRVVLAADAALDVPAAPAPVIDRAMREAGLNGERPILGVNINRYFDTWAADARGLGEKVLDIYAEGLSRALRQIEADVLFVATQHMDVEVTRRLMDMTHCTGRKAMMDNRGYDHYTIKGILGRLDMVCAMRLHCAIMAAGELTPVVALEYQPKLAHFMETLGMPENCLSFTDFSPAMFSQFLIRHWEQRARIKERLCQIVPVLQRRSRVPAVIIAALDRGLDLEQAVETGRQYLQNVSG